MTGLTIVLIGFFGVSTLTFGGYVKAQANDVVLKTNVISISKALTSYEIFNGKYPESLEELEKEEGVSKIDSNYVYKRTMDGKNAAVLGASDNNSYCWNSEQGSVFEVKPEVSCSL